MLSRFLANPSRHFRLLTRSLSPPHPSAQPLKLTHFISRHFSSNNNNNNDDDGEKPISETWSFTRESDNLGTVFGSGTGDMTGNGGGGDLGNNDWLNTEGFMPWSLRSEVKKVEDVFNLGDVGKVGEDVGSVDEVGLVGGNDNEGQDSLELQKEEEALLSVLKGPDRAFGDLVAASGITDAMLDSLIALKDFKNIEGLPPLTEIEDQRYWNSMKKSSRYEMELQKQEEAARSRVRQVDEKGRAYGTGRRKCSVARVWIEPGQGKFSINDKEFDVYFPMLDHRAALLRPFAETKTLGLWDVKCTVKGGGVSGQVGAIRLGVSRALQCWEPGLRPPLREAGFLSRDPRVVERKKPGKAKARKSFQWVKR